MPDAAISVAEQQVVHRLLAAAAATVGEVPYCWVATPAENGGANARVVKSFANAAGEDVWTRWFLTLRSGRKAVEISRSGRVTLAYQHASGEAYVTLAGPAALIDEPSEVDARLLQVDDPDGRLAGRLVAVRVAVDHIELHIRGVTAEPWGHGRTMLQRERDGDWRLMP